MRGASPRRASKDVKSEHDWLHNARAWDKCQVIGPQKFSFSVPRGQRASLSCRVFLVWALAGGIRSPGGRLSEARNHADPDLDQHKPTVVGIMSTDVPRRAYCVLRTTVPTVTVRPAADSSPSHRTRQNNESG